MTPPALPLYDGLRPGGRFGEWAPAPPGYVVADVDGTLLGADRRATAQVEAAVRACVDSGLPVGLATGRMPGACNALAAQLGTPGPHVVHNGAEVRAEGRRVAAWPLTPAAARLVAQGCLALGCYAEFYVGEGFWVTDRRPPARRHWEILGREPDGLLADLDLERVEVIKVTAMALDDDGARAVVEGLAVGGLLAGLAHAPALPGIRFVNVTDAEADKGQAVATAAARLGVPAAAVVAIGDGHNDLPMLQVAGTAIAMGQAAPEVQAAAHLVVPAVQADGVAHALRAVTAWAVAG